MSITKVKMGKPKEKKRKLSEETTKNVINHIQNVYDKTKGGYAEKKTVFSPEICKEAKVSTEWGLVSFFENYGNMKSTKTEDGEELVKWIGPEATYDYCYEMRLYQHDKKSIDDLNRKKEKESRQLQLELKEIQIETNLPSNVLKSTNGEYKPENTEIILSKKENPEPTKKREQMGASMVELLEKLNDKIDKNNELLKILIEIHKAGNQTLKNIENLYTPYATNQTK